MHRLFVGLRPPAPVRETLLAIMEGVAGARWQDDEQLHLTLRFIGEVDRPAAEDVVTVLARVSHPAPAVAVRGVGAFGRKGQPHTLWAGIAPDERLSVLHKRVERALVLAGIAPEPRAFLPHITLARLNRQAGPVEPFLARNAALSLPPATPAAFLLYESRLGRGGATYDVVARFPLD